MEIETIALEIEIRQSHKKEEAFFFNDTMLHALMSGLSVVYKEVFIWSVGRHLAVWAVGGNASFLSNTFMHHRDHYKKMQLTSGAKARELFANIVAGKTWNDCSLASKQVSYMSACELSSELDSMGLNLPQIDKGLSWLDRAPEISEARNFRGRLKKMKGLSGTFPSVDIFIAPALLKFSM